MINKIRNLHLYNSLSRNIELFQPINERLVRLYLCGPTVYGPPHLGHARSSISFDILIRYLHFLGYSTRFVRNYTDVGHLEHDSDEGDDKISKQAIKEHLLPEEIAQKYINIYREYMSMLNILPPDVEPLATGFIPEQIKIISKIIDEGFAYIVNGSVYFDVCKYNNVYKSYGCISGRVIEDCLNTRNITKSDEKRNIIDFALWKKADSKHIMKWESPWSIGFPGWHSECIAISQKLLGATFDIHGGGLDLKFPHHECEIAQSQVINNSKLANIWFHNNLITINEQKMSKSLGNFITLEELFLGNNLTRAYHPMVFRFFVLQSHYRSTLSFSEDSLIAAEKGLLRIFNSVKTLNDFIASYEDENNENNENNENVLNEKIDEGFSALDNDLNTAKVISCLFDLVTFINDLNTNIQLSKESLINFRTKYLNIIEDILGLKLPTIDDSFYGSLLEIYKKVKISKDYEQVDFIRGIFREKGLNILDTKNGIKYSYNENILYKN